MGWSVSVADIFGTRALLPLVAVCCKLNDIDVVARQALLYVKVQLATVSRVHLYPDGIGKGNDYFHQSYPTVIQGDIPAGGATFDGKK